MHVDDVAGNIRWQALPREGRVEVALHGERQRHLTHGVVAHVESETKV
jgi:hypothetical protein